MSKNCLQIHNYNSVTQSFMSIFTGAFFSDTNNEIGSLPKYLLVQYTSPTYYTHNTQIVYNIYHKGHCTATGHTLHDQNSTMSNSGKKKIREFKSLKNVQQLDSIKSNEHQSSLSSRVEMMVYK